MCMSVYVWAQAHHSTGVKGRGKLVGINSPLPPYESQGSNPVVRQELITSMC